MRLGGPCGPCRGPEPTTADVLSEHVVFEVESVDRMYLIYQHKLQYGGGVSAFFVGHRGHKYASSVLMAPITGTFVANIHHFINAWGLDLLSFGKGEDKDAIAHRYLADFPGTDGVPPARPVPAPRARRTHRPAPARRRTPAPPTAPTPTRSTTSHARHAWPHQPPTTEVRAPIHQT